MPAWATCWPGIPPRSSRPLLDRPTRAWLTALAAWARAEEAPARPILAGLTRSLFLREGRSGTQVELLDAEGVDGSPPMPDSAGADLLGLAHEALLAPVDRRARGADYTPPALADRLVAITLSGSPDRVLDPACGGGAFLLAAGRALDLPPRESVRRLFGVDIDPLAADVARAATALWSGGTPAEVTVADFLVEGASGADVVVGNPPFRSPLRAGGTPGPRAYTDISGRFLLKALDVVGPGGRVGLIQPQSVLAARDAAPVRAAVSGLRALWIAEAKVFSASTHVVAVVAERDGEPGPVDLYAGRAVDFRGRAAGSWAHLAARARGLPDVRLAGKRTLGDEASTTAGFRRQYYGLRDHVTEWGAGSPLVTSGLIEPGHCAWGERTARIGGQPWLRPTVDLQVLDDDVQAWFSDRLVPKLLVATQTKVVEVVIDEAGVLLPSVPVISVAAPARRLWPLAAALMSPPVTAWALQRAIGTGLSADALRLSASLLRDVPLPTDDRAWSAATNVLRAGDLAAYAPLACRAYAADPSLADWWLARAGLGAEPIGEATWQAQR